MKRERLEDLGRIREILDCLIDSEMFERGISCESFVRIHSELPDSKERLAQLYFLLDKTYDVLIHLLYISKGLDDD